MKVIFVALALVFVSAMAQAKKLKVGDEFPLASMNGLEILATDKGPEGPKGKWDSGRMKGKVLLLDFWASWCGPCKEALPVYDQISSKYSDKNLMVIGINVDDQIAQGIDFLRTHKVKFPHVFDLDKKLIGQIEVETMPTSFLIDKYGKVHDIHLGFRAGDQAKTDAKVRRLLELPSK